MRKVRRLCPDLVVCSRASDVVREHVSSGVELYLHCGSLSGVCLDGECSAVEHLELSDFLEIVRGGEALGTSGLKTCVPLLFLVPPGNIPIEERGWPARIGGG